HTRSSVSGSQQSCRDHYSRRFLFKLESSGRTRHFRAVSFNSLIRRGCAVECKTTLLNSSVFLSPLCGKRRRKPQRNTPNPLISFSRMPSERLQKIIAAAGIASRRKAEQMITSGLVSVNGQIVTELGTKADPEHDLIRVMEKMLHSAELYI